MTERERILARIREALQVAAPLPRHGHEHASMPGPPSHGAREWLPLVGPTFEDRLSLFQKNATDLRAEFHLLQTKESLAKTLQNLRDAEGWKRVATHRRELTEVATQSLNLPMCWTDKGYEVSELEQCDAGITACDALIAQTGSVLLTSRSAGGRALSVLPPHHVVLAKREQLVADLPEAFALLKQQYAPNYPSFITLITGPSRTGDIERILVLGAHGPKKLTILAL